MLKRWFLPGNGMQSNHSLVEKHNIQLCKLCKFLGLIGLLGPFMIFRWFWYIQKVNKVDNKNLKKLPKTPLNCQIVAKLPCLVTILLQKCIVRGWPTQAFEQYKSLNSYSLSKVTNEWHNIPLNNTKWAVVKVQKKHCRLPLNYLLHFDNINHWRCSNRFSRGITNFKIGNSNLSNRLKILNRKIPVTS